MCIYVYIYIYYIQYYSIMWFSKNMDPATLPPFLTVERSCLVPRSAQHGWIFPWHSFVKESTSYLSSSQWISGMQWRFKHQSETWKLHSTTLDLGYWRVHQCPAQEPHFGFKNSSCFFFIGLSWCCAPTFSCSYILNWAWKHSISIYFDVFRTIMLEIM